MMSRLILLFLTLSVFSPHTLAQDDTTDSSWIVVVNSNSGLHSLSKDQVIGLFLGRTQFLPTGSKVKPIDYPIDSNNRANFYYALTGKNIADIDAYWARLRYSGRASPPQPLENEEEIMARLQSQDSAIAYLPSKYVSVLKKYGLISVLTMRYN